MDLTVEIYSLVKCLPKEETYDGYLQIENGVGMTRCFHEEFHAAVRTLLKIRQARGLSLLRMNREERELRKMLTANPGRRVSTISGVLAFGNREKISTALIWSLI